MGLQKKQRAEVRQLHTLMQCLGLPGEDWQMQEHRDRPDFFVRLRGHQTVGIELTEVVPPAHGLSREHERRAALVVREAVLAAVQSRGGRGAFVIGNLREIPRSELERQQLTLALSQFFETHGGGLTSDGARIREKFMWQGVELLAVSRRDDRDDVVLIDNGAASSLPHRAERGERTITAAFARVIRAKCERAIAYERGYPLWLAMRNPNQRMVRVPPPLRRVACRRARGVFSRVIVFNDREGVIDARPPEPRYLDVLPP